MVICLYTANYISFGNNGSSRLRWSGSHGSPSHFNRRMIKTQEDVFFGPKLNNPPYSSGEPLFSLLQDTGNPRQRYPYKLCLRPGLSSSDIFNISRLLLRLLQGLLRAHGSYGTRLLIHIAQIILTVIRTRAVPVGKNKGVVA